MRWFFDGMLYKAEISLSRVSALELRQMMDSLSENEALGHLDQSFSQWNYEVQEKFLKRHIIYVRWNLHVSRHKMGLRSDEYLMGKLLVCHLKLGLFDELESEVEGGG